MTVSPSLRAYTKMPMAGSGQRVGLFGGSFNPPHEGHVHVCELALRQLKLDWVWWLVTPGNPLKDHTELVPLEERLAACETITDDPRMKITALEAAWPTSYTADTLFHIVAQNPHIDFVWLMGADNLGQFHRWERWREIVKLMPFAVIDRPGSTMALHSAPVAKTLARYRVDEDDAAMVAGRVHPADERDGLADVILAEFVAVMCAHEIRWSERRSFGRDLENLLNWAG